MNGNIDNELVIFIATASHTRFVQEAIALDAEKVVVSVKHWWELDINPEFVRIEQYLDAELIDGCAISWRLEVTTSDSGHQIEADVRKIISNSYDMIAEIAETSVVSVEQCMSAVKKTLDELFSTDWRACGECD
ncbi:hypothetical protein [Planctomicrobium piriforme]|uniref:Uncharacterized protein n=1 Tax=Planctomicrobium piriforme TaxID=1576369 RepID=A0A1I3KXU9_9PLAN|nr:hypothetical protein [Planctomicrobium piriforme]SFI77158.1 hypothetical protein SAMN05421753_11273 [Planctomicrobium piriforme]